MSNNTEKKVYRFGKQYLHLAETDSTNEVMKRLLHDGVTVEVNKAGGRLIEGEPLEGTVVYADYQAEGKGRRGRSWNGEKGMSLMYSLLLEPDTAADNLPMLTLVVAIGVCRTIRNMYRIDAEIKWPNDIVYDGKKIAGILTEMEPADGINYVIVGVGINVFQTEFPEDIRKKATSLAQQSAESYGIEELLYDILHRTEEYYDIFLKTGDMSGLIDEYNSYLAGKEGEVKVLDPKEPYKGTALGINDKGELLVRDSAGTVRKVYAGEVSIGGIYGE